MLYKYPVFLTSDNDIVSSYVSDGHTILYKMGHKISKTSQSDDKANDAPKASNWIPIANKPVFTPRKLRVVCVGAGYAGLMVAYKYKHEYHMDDYVDLAIYEKNSDVGGTWFENRYPGLTCDVYILYSLCYKKRGARLIEIVARAHLYVPV